MFDFQAYLSLSSLIQHSARSKPFDLDRRLSHLTQSIIQNCLLSDFNRFGMGVNRDTQISGTIPSNIRQGSAMEPNRPERRNCHDPSQHLGRGRYSKTIAGSQANPHPG
ncbi:hypothetical protein KY285_001058 [Solanum tuberosum]|nr:hypothetical protein KY285_001058 [Solanum tuberosum]